MRVIRSELKSSMDEITPTRRRTTPEAEPSQSAQESPTPSRLIGDGAVPSQEAEILSYFGNA